MVGNKTVCVTGAYFRDAISITNRYFTSPFSSRRKASFTCWIFTKLFLNYCTRFYDRQFITRDTPHKGTLEKFEALLINYFSSDKPQANGLPTVTWCANELHLSPNYFGDLIKKETGRSAQEYIQAKVIDLAKERILGNDTSIGEIAYEHGFKYPQHFTRLFKQRVGHTPNEYRNLN